MSAPALWPVAMTAVDDVSALNGLLGVGRVGGAVIVIVLPLTLRMRKLPLFRLVPVTFTVSPAAKPLPQSRPSLRTIVPLSMIGVKVTVVWMPVPNGWTIDDLMPFLATTTGVVRVSVAPLMPAIV